MLNANVGIVQSE